MARSLPALVTLALMLLAAPAFAQEDEPAPPESSGGPDWQSWISLDEDEAPEPPLLRLQGGVILGVDVVTRVQADRGLQGSRLDDLEGEQGLDSHGLAPWAELSVGGSVRVGADFTWLTRQGDYTLQEQAIRFDGQEVTDAGGYLRPKVGYLSAGTFLEWDLLYGKTYRMGLLGGVRYFRFDVELKGVRKQLPRLTQANTRAELISPYFGGLVQLTPFPYLTVQTDIQVMNWSWQQIRLKSARYLRFRLGFTIRPLPEWFGVGLDYRFEVIRAEGRASRTHGRRITGAQATNGLVLQLELYF